MSKQNTVEYLQTVDIKIYPNPTTGLLHIKTNSNTNQLDCILYGSNGETLLNGQFSNQTKILLDISHYSRSTYYLALFKGTEKRVWKIIKQ
jgi:hypothetical protein